MWEPIVGDVKLWSKNARNKISASLAQDHSLRTGRISVRIALPR